MSLPPGLIIRAGTPGDAAFIQRVHEESIRGLGPRCYSRAQVESSGFRPDAGKLCPDRESGGERFLLAEPETGGGRLASFCSFGGDRVIGLYTHPHWARRGVAGALLACAEAAILADGHQRVRITATLGGSAFYEKHGYRVFQARQLPHPRWAVRGGAGDGEEVSAGPLFPPRPPIGGEGAA